MIQERIQTKALQSNIAVFQPKKQKKPQLGFISSSFDTLNVSLNLLSKSDSTQIYGEKFLQNLGYAFQAEACLLIKCDAQQHATVIEKKISPYRSTLSSISSETILPEYFPDEYCQQYRCDIVTYPFLYKLKSISPVAYRYWKGQGFRSIVFIPIWQSNAIKGWIIVGTLSYFQEWQSISADVLGDIQRMSKNLIERIHLESSLKKYQSQQYHSRPQFYSNEADSSSETEMKWIAQRDMTPIFFNQAWLDFVGLNLKDALSRDWRSMIHPDDIHRFSTMVHRATERNSAYSVTCRIRRSDGEYRWILHSGQPKKMTKRPSSLFMGSCLDITDQIYDYSHITDYDSYVEWLSSSTNDGFFTYDLEDHRSLYLSSQFIAMLGYEETVKADLVSIFQPYLNVSDLEHLTQTLHNHRRDRTPFCVEYLFQLNDQKHTPFQIRGGYHHHTEAHPGQFIGSLHRVDIESLRSREARLQQDWAQTTLISIGEPVLTTDIDGKITYLNSHAEALTGHLFEDVLGQPVHDVIKLIHEYTGRRVTLPILKETHIRHRKILDEDTVLVSKDKSHINVQISVAPILSQGQQHFGMIMVLHDVTQTKQASKQLAWEAKHDPLTGLYNRREFEDQLQYELARVQADATQHVLFFMDLDRFKLVNDSAGHLAGDALLKQISDLLLVQIRPSDLIARMGGDEFCILLRNCDLQAAEQIAENIRTSIRRFRFSWNDAVFTVGMSIGLVQISSDSQGYTDILNAADLACHMAKENGRDRIQVYQEGDHKLAAQRDHRGWGIKIQQALEENKFQLLYQKIYPINRPEECSHAEILIRMNDSARGLISPNAFLSSAERYDLMPKVDQWVLQRSLDLIQKIQSQSNENATYPAQWMINLSGASLNNDEFIEDLIRQLSQFEGQTENIGFEITETVAIANLERTRRLINICKTQGCQFALDDFGCGVSSFEYLKSLPVDFIKIDGQFITSMVNEEHVKAMVEAINHVGHVMKIKTIAEWVETTEQYDMLKTVGVDYIQGFGFHRPQSFTIDAPC